MIERSQPSTSSGHQLAGARPGASTGTGDQSSHVIGVDLGGTKLCIGLGRPTGSVLAETRVATDRRGGLHVVAQIAAVARDLARQSGIDPRTLRLAVIGGPGALDPVTGRITMAQNIPDFDTLDVAGALQSALAMPVRFENDVNLHAMGEWHQGKGRDLSSFALVALGTGLGMGLVIDGKLWRGAHGGAGEIAYLPLGGDPYSQANHVTGPLESVVGTAGMLARYRAAGGAADITVRDIFTRFGSGDMIARQVIAETARALALGLAAVAAVLDPALFILSGSIGARPELVDILRYEVGRCSGRPIRIAVSELAQRGAMLGALELGRQMIAADRQDD
jgi:predicted NBD/HSP70 family sugar kinase